MDGGGSFTCLAIVSCHVPNGSCTGEGGTRVARVIYIRGMRPRISADIRGI